MIERWRWRFDLDGCLVDSFGATSLRPHARRLLDALRAAGCEVTVWSAGGAPYAQRVLTRLEIGLLVDHVYTKTRGSDGKWLLDGIDPATMVCVDDQPDGLPAGVEVLTVFPYLGPNPHDRALSDLLGRVRPLPSPSSMSLHRTGLG